MVHSKMLLLFEHATGYAVFKVKQFEEVGMFLPQLEAAVNDPSRFQDLVQLLGFSRFKSSVAALENINAVSEGVASPDLIAFLQTCKISSKSQLGVLDPKLGAAISEALSVSCTHVGAVPELVRGVRVHFPHLVRAEHASLTHTSEGIAQLGLGHAYSRAKVKFNVHRVDNMIIQAIGLLDQMDKDVNTFSMRIREWYAFHFPELVKLVPDNVTFAKVAKAIGDRKALTEEHLEVIQTAGGVDASIAEAILTAARSSMGMDISPVDLISICAFATRVVSLAQFRTELAQYLHGKMTDVAPNLAALIGDQVAARLISHAGSLTNLAKCPASTVQILGAEKALFRALKTRGNTPKYGLIYNSSFIARAGAKNKGRISRFLANKCSIAARIDCFGSGDLGSVYGDKLRQQVEDRMRFHQSGDVPKKNLDVMLEAQQELQQIMLNSDVKNNKNDDGAVKRKRKTTKSNIDESNASNDGLVVNGDGAPSKKKKKRASESVVPIEACT